MTEAEQKIKAAADKAEADRKAAADRAERDAKAKAEAEQKAAADRAERDAKAKAEAEQKAAEGPAAKSPKMDAGAFLQRMKESGTGDAKLLPARNYVAKHPDAGILELIDLIVAAGAPEATVKKAHEVAGLPYAPSGQSEVTRPLFPVRCPPGGCEVQGRSFKAGEVVPEELLNKADADEIRLLCSAGTTVGPKPAGPAK